MVGDELIETGRTLMCEVRIRLRKQFTLLRMHSRVENYPPVVGDLLIAAGVNTCFRSMKRLGVFLLPLDGMLVHRRSLTD